MATDGSQAGAGGLTAEAALALRRAIYGGKAQVTRQDVADLIARGRDAGDSPEFAALLAEATVDLMARQVDPERYVGEADADWLIGLLGDGGGLTCRAEFMMLQDLMRYAVSVPPALTRFAVREVEKAILSGRRGAYDGEGHPAGVVTAEDVAALRAMVFAPTEGSSLHVDRESAEALFDIAHATAGKPNDPEFAVLFAQAVGNYLTGTAFLGTAGRADAADREQALDQAGWLVEKAAPSLLKRVLREMESVEEIENDAFAGQNAAEAEAERQAAPIDPGETRWMVDQLSRGPLSEAERRLLAFLSKDGAKLPPEIAAIAARAA